MLSRTPRSTACTCHLFSRRHSTSARHGTPTLTACKTHSAPSAHLVGSAALTRVQLARLSRLRQCAWNRDVRAFSAAIERRSQSDSVETDAVTVARHPRTTTDVQRALARRFAATGNLTTVTDAADPAPSSMQAPARTAAQTQAHVRLVLARAQHGLTSATEAVWSALRLRTESASSQRSHSAHTSQLGDRSREHQAAPFTASYATDSTTPMQLCALASWCAREVQACAADVSDAAADVCCCRPPAPHNSTDSASEGVPGRHRAVIDATRPPPMLHELSVLRAAAEHPRAGQPCDGALHVCGTHTCDWHTATVVLCAARDVCTLLRTYLSLVVHDMFVQGGFGEEAEDAHTPHVEPSTTAASRQLRVEARETCERVLAILEALHEHALPVWRAGVATSVTQVDEPQRVRRGLRLGADIMQLALCSQREHWPSALALAARMCEWNNSLQNRTAPPPPQVPSERADMAGEAALADVTRLAASLSQDTRLIMAFILAQHGERALTEIFLSALPSHPHPHPHPPASSYRDVAGLVRALAMVNNDATQSLAWTEGPTAHSSMHEAGASVPPLVALVQHGLVPNRTLGVAEYAALLRLVDHLHRRESKTTASTRNTAASPPPPTDWLLSPAQVWRHTAGYPHPLRSALCLLSFRVAVRHSLVDTMRLEDLFVVTSLTRQTLREQARALQRHPLRRDVGTGVVGDQPLNEDQGAKPTSDGTHTASSRPWDLFEPTADRGAEDAEAALQRLCGALPVLLLPARRAAAPYTTAHLIHLCQTYHAIHHGLQPLPASPASPTRAKAPSLPRGGVHVPEPSSPMMTLVPQELLRTLQLAHGDVTLHTVLTTCWEAALAAVRACQIAFHTPLPWAYSTPPSSVSASPRDDTPQLDSLLETLAGALEARLVEVRRTHTISFSPLSPSRGDGALPESGPGGRAAPAAVTGVAPRAVRVQRALLPLLEVVPYLDPFTTARLVLGPAGRELTWAHCLRLMPYTPLGSPSQLHLLRRLAQDREGRRAATAYLPDTLHWSREALRNVSQAAARGGASRSAGLTAEQQALAVLLETQWSRALAAFDVAPPRAQRSAAPHVVRLLVEADVWRDVSETTLRPLVRLAVRASPGTGQASRVLPSASATILGNRLIAHDVPHRPPCRVDDDASDLTEEVLQTALQRGLWLTGLQFQQMVAEEDPQVLERSPRARLYASLLSRGLLEKSALARAVALLLRATRRGQWEAAVQHFIEFATHRTDAPPPTAEADSTHHTPGTDAPVAAPPQLPHDLTRTRSWVFRTAIPPELAQVALAVRYALLQSESCWRVALSWLPVSPSLPLPFSHEALVKARYGPSAPVGGRGGDDAAAATARLLHTLSPTSALPHASAVSSSPSPLSTSVLTNLVTAARRGDRVRRPSEDAQATQANVHHALQLLHQHGEWESAMLVYTRTIEAGTFPYADSAIALATTIDGGAPWYITLRYFAHMSQRLRPDVATAAVALQACAAGQQWEVAFRVLRQCVLTQSRPAPYLVESAIHTALHCGAWSRALQAAHTYRRTRNARLAHAVLSTYVAAKQWDEAVQYFYECAVHGLRPLDSSIELALAASEAVSEEYRNMAMMVGAVASALEDVYHISGVVMEHVVLVHRHWQREHAQQHQSHVGSGAVGSGERGGAIPLHLEASSQLRFEYSPSPPTTDDAPDDLRVAETGERVYPLRFY